MQKLNTILVSVVKIWPWWYFYSPLSVSEPVIVGSPSHKSSTPIEIPSKASPDDPETAGGAEQLLNAVTFLESHEFQSAKPDVKTEPLHIQKPVSTPVWNLLHSSIDSPGVFLSNSFLFIWCIPGSLDEASVFCCHAFIFWVHCCLPCWTV